MADLLPQDELPEDLGPVLKRRPLRDDTELDITPMIDITFLLLIFFIVASIPDSNKKRSLPSAVHGKSVNARDAIFVTVVAGDDRSAIVYLGESADGEPLAADHELQREALLEYVREKIAAGKSKVIIKADRALRSGDMIRITSTAGEDAIEVNIYWAVRESKE